MPYSLGGHLYLMCISLVGLPVLVRLRVLGVSQARSMAVATFMWTVLVLITGACHNTFSIAISLKIKASLLTIDGPPENSSDLERAAAARSIADEFSGGPSIVNALQRCENTRFHIHTAPFGIRSPPK